MRACSNSHQEGNSNLGKEQFLTSLLTMSSTKTIDWKFISFFPRIIIIMCAMATKFRTWKGKKQKKLNAEWEYLASSRAWFLEEEEEEFMLITCLAKPSLFSHLHTTNKQLGTTLIVPEFEALPQLCGNGKCEEKEVGRKRLAGIGDVRTIGDGSHEHCDKWWM